eukprot:49529_1
MADSKKSKWVTLFTNSLFWSRITMLIFSLFVFSLSCAYCIAQLVHVELDLVTECPEPKSTETIWEHSYNASLKNHGQLDANAYESQFGHTTESCMSTKRIEINTHQLWNRNFYIQQWDDQLNAKCVLFGFVALYCLVIIIYNIFTIATDIFHVSKGTLHTQSNVYIKSNKSKPTSRKQQSMCMIRLDKWRQTYKEITAPDTTGWVMQMCISEMIEIILQSNALMLYNGHHTSDDGTGVYLAKKPEFIIMFAVFIILNCFGSSLAWISYIIAPNHCHGLVFKLSLFFVDQVADLFYSMFPFLSILYDDYSVRSTNAVLLGQLNTASALAFLSAFVPLILLSNKCLMITFNSSRKMRDDWYYKWKQTQTNNAVQKTAQSQGNTTDANVVNAIQQVQKPNNWLRKQSATDKRNRFKTSVLVMIALVYIITGIVIVSVVTNTINESKEYCDSVKESKYFSNGTFNNHTLSLHEQRLLASNPELFYWDLCLYKVYPFTSNPTHKCQCRVFVIDWTKLNSTMQQRRTHFNLTQQKILTGALRNWNMLEKFSSAKVEGEYSEQYIITESEVNAPFLKAFEVQFAQLLLPEDISGWNKLNYLKLEENGLDMLPNSASAFTQMKYLSIINNPLTTFPTAVCEWIHLEILEIQWTQNITIVPECISELKSLKQILLDGAFGLNLLNLSIFNLPDLYDLSLFRSSLNYIDLLEYNLPITIELNDTLAIDAWFNETFAWNSNADFWFQLTPICDEPVDLPSKLQIFVDDVAKCDYNCTWESTSDFRVDQDFCIPLLLGDGSCDKNCDIAQCAYDLGDCVQLCFAEEYTNCSWELYTNDVCDDGCNNKYCKQYKWSSDFRWAITKAKVNSKGESIEHSADFHHCQDEGSLATPLNVLNMSKDACDWSVSTYVDTGRDAHYCPVEWIGDGLCDDACRTDACLQDSGDCELGCLDDICSQIYQTWNLFPGTSTYLVHHSIVCTDWLPLAILLVANNENMNEFTPENCLQKIADTDHNNDKHMNFREFVQFGYEIFMDSFGMSKPRQVNCSACIGMEYYNIRHITGSEVLASSSACWSSRDWSYASGDYIFNAPADGIISGVRLVHTSGDTTCSVYGGRSNWGCNDYDMFVQLVHITDVNTKYGETYYPRIGDTNDTQIGLDSPSDCVHGCAYRYYTLAPYVRSTDLQFSWINPRYSITKEDQFMLADGEACCEITNEDNDGIVCAEVYFLYDTISIRTTDAMTTTNETDVDGTEHNMSVMWLMVCFCNIWMVQLNCF